MSGKGEGISFPNDNPRGNRPPSSDRTWFLYQPREAKKARLPTREGNEMLDRSIQESRNQGERDDIINRINDLESIMQRMGTNDNPWKNITRPKAESIRKAIIDITIQRSWDQVEGNNITNRTKKCAHDAKSILQPLRIPLNATLARREHLFLGYKILKKVFYTTWEDTKGNNLTERSQICKDAVQEATKQINSYLFTDLKRDLCDITVSMNNVEEDLKKIRRSMNNDIARWKDEGLPGKQATLNDDEKKFCADISSNPQHIKKIEQLYSKCDTRNPLDIDPKRLAKDPETYYRLHPYLSKLEAADKELKLQIRQIVLFQYPIIRDTYQFLNGSNDSGLPRISARALGGILASIEENWLAPARSECDAAKMSLEEEYRHIISQKQQP